MLLDISKLVRKFEAKNIDEGPSEMPKYEYEEEDEDEKQEKEYGKIKVIEFFDPDAFFYRNLAG
jgi:hypothetical protein